MSPWFSTLAVAVIAFAECPVLAMQDTLGAVAGYVMDAQTEKPLQFATVSVVGESMETAVRAGGVFRVDQLPPGKHTLEARFVGYWPARVQHVQVTRGATTTLIFRLMLGWNDDPVIGIPPDSLGRIFSRIKRSPPNERLAEAVRSASRIEPFLLKGAASSHCPAFGGYEIESRGRPLNTNERGLLLHLARRASQDDCGHGHSYNFDGRYGLRIIAGSSPLDAFLSADCAVWIFKIDTEVVRDINPFPSCIQDSLELLVRGLFATKRE
jgi:hypothetical protein